MIPVKHGRRVLPACTRLEIDPYVFDSGERDDDCSGVNGDSSIFRMINLSYA